MTSKRGLSLAWVLWLSSASFAQGPSPSLGEVLRTRQLVAPKALRDLPVTRQNRRAGVEMTFESWTAEDAQWRVEVELQAPCSPAVAETKIAARRRAIARLYQDQITPYPGEITRVQACPHSLQPQARDFSLLGKATPALFVRATSRFTLGSCDPQTAVVPGALAWAYRPERRELVELKVFYRGDRGAKVSPEKLLDALGGIRDLHP